MKEIRYSIHGLIDIIIEKDVKEAIIQQIEFQIGHFRKRSGNERAKYKITIKNYKSLEESSEEEVEIFHIVRGVKGKIIDDEKRKIAIKKEEWGYTFFTDVPFLINLYIQLIIIKEGATLIHAAAVADNNGGVMLFPGAGGVGKTAIIGYLVKKNRYRTLGDDIVGLTKEGECLSFPRSFVLKEYHRMVYPEVFEELKIEKKEKKQKKSNIKLWKLIKENAPMKGITKGFLKRMGLWEKSVKKEEPFLAAVPIEKILGKGTIAERGIIERIIFLKRYNGKEFKTDTINEEEISRRMFAILQHEWVEIMREFFSLAALEIVDLEEYFKEVATTIKSGVSRKKCEVVSIPNNSSPEELWKYISSKIKTD